LPVSTTYFMLGIVSDVSATLVATTTNLAPNHATINMDAQRFNTHLQEEVEIPSVEKQWRVLNTMAAHT
jgi:hypothetical protein